MKVVVLANYCEALLRTRGALLAAMVNAGNEVIGCAPDPSPPVASRFRALGVRYHEIRLRRTGLSPFRDLASTVEITRFLKAERPDCLLNYTIKPVIYGSLAASRARVPRIFSVITGLGYVFTGRTLKHRLLKSLVCVLYRASLKRNAAVFFLNPDDMADFGHLKLLAKTTKAVLLNGEGVEVDGIWEKTVFGGPPVFLLVARLIRDKGIVEYVKAARLLRHRYPQAVFKLVGPLDPANPEAIRPEEIDRWRAEGVVQYEGFVKDVGVAHAASSVHVLPSFYREGVPRTILEAMAIGRPVITTDVPGCRDTTVHGENGFLVPPRDVNALANAMEQFILKPELIDRMGVRSRQIAVERFDVRKVNKVILTTMGLV